MECGQLLISFILIYFLGSRDSTCKWMGLLLALMPRRFLTMMHYVTVCKKIGVSVCMHPLNSIKSQQ